MSSSLEKRELVLLYLAARQGPSVDQIEVRQPPFLRVQDMLRSLVADGSGGPAELRAALLDLVAAGLVAMGPRSSGQDGDLTGELDTVCIVHS